MEWTAPGIVLSASPYGETGAIVHVLTQQHGPYRGLARGGQGRRQRATWQPGNLVALRWLARLPEQLGTLSGETIHDAAARVLDAPQALAMLSSCCALADAALPERETQQAIFDGLLSLISRLSLAPEDAAACRADLLRWECRLLAVLGFGLDLSACAVDPSAGMPEFVSPRTGRAVSRAAAGAWAPRLLALPSCLRGEDGAAGIATAAVDDADWLAGLQLTGHFIERDVCGHHHRGLPAARLRLLHAAQSSSRQDLQVAQAPSIQTTG